MGRATTGCWLILLVLVTVGASGRDLRLIEAAKKGDSAAVRALMRQQVDVNIREPDGTTALHWAIHGRYLEIVSLLVRSGANIRAENRYGVTPLALAALNGPAPIIEALLEAGADPNTTIADGETVLMTAARTGDTEAVSLLLAHGAAVNLKETWRGQTALMWAVAERQAAVVDLLINAGADIHARSNKGFTPFLFAVRSGDFAIVRRLLRAGADVNQPGGEGTPPLTLAIVNAHYELAAFLMDAGADLSADAPGGTALHAAVRTRNYEYGKVVRPAAVQTGNLDDLGLIRRLLDYGAYVDARIVKPLPRQGGFDNNYLPLVGATPFLLAARAADPTTMRILLEYGADPSLPTNQKVTPLMVAAGTGYVQGQSIGGERERLEAVRLLVELGADIEAASDSGETAMHGAATGGVNDVVLLLVDHGARLDVKSKDGWTPLSIADGTRSAFRMWPHTAELIRRLLKEAPQ
jgi:ankyrin repeat protein